MTIATYNVNGLRSALNKGLIDWIQATNPDILCFQEIKSQEEQLDLEQFRKLGYEPHLYSAQKKGYSGVAVLSKAIPDKVVRGMKHDLYDFEGRSIRLDFGELTLVNTYFPSGSSGDLRQGIKMEFLAYYQDYINELRKERPNLIICGDYNICHRPIDIHNPVSNAKSSGFLPEERAWMEQFLQQGFIDSFRHLNKDPHHYTWWSYRMGARARNLGWRIDYICVADRLKSSIKRSVILPNAMHSDHCPVLVEMELKSPFE
jgi:exodeoxyribonuclease-3